GWTGLYETNKDLLGSDPDLILPGQNLDLGLERGQDQGAEKSAEAPAAN
ncbi:transglycosylase domain-containing protein, partial [Streptomyces sp. SID4931]